MTTAPANPIALHDALRTTEEQLRRMSTGEQWGRVTIVVERGQIRLIEISRTVRGEEQLRHAAAGS